MSDCIPWLGAVTENGYGMKKVNGRMVRVHRHAYELAYGPIPAGMVIDHTCHNDSGCAGGPECPHRRCVNPAHLEAVTQGENLRRSPHTQVSKQAARRAERAA